MFQSVYFQIRMLHASRSNGGSSGYIRGVTPISSPEQLRQLVSIQMEEMVLDFGVHAKPLRPGMEYRDNNVLYEEGGPGRFWLRVESEALGSLQRWIQQHLGHTTLQATGRRLGEHLLAR